MRSNLLHVFFIGILFLAGCVPYDQESFEDIAISFSSAELQKIYNFQDNEETDSLLVYLSAKAPSIRLVAAQAFSSIQDSAFTDTLASLLYDRNNEVRIAAAYALGQTRASKAAKHLAAAFKSDDSTGVYNQFNSTILEAVGKCGGKNYLAYLSSIKTYKPTDTLLLIGQCKGLYRFALRKMISPEGTRRMSEIAINKIYPEEARFWAANYLARAGKINLRDFTNSIVQAFISEENAAIRMALATALEKTDREQAFPIIVASLNKEKDYRVRCNLLRALYQFPPELVSNVFDRFLNDSVIHVSGLASAYFVEKGRAREASNYYQRSLDSSLQIQTKITLLRAANRHLPAYYKNSRYQVITELEKILESTKNPYLKADVIAAISEYPRNYNILAEIMRGSGFQVMQTAALEGIAHICRLPDFDLYFGSERRIVRKELAEILKEAVLTGDAGLVAIGAGVFANSSIDFKRIITDYTFLLDAKEKLKLPGEIETLYELEKAIAYFREEEVPQKLIPEPNHEIRWDLIEMLDEETRAIIQTNKGKIILSFFPKEAPASVSNFVELASSGFYNRKAFHRVVPNFVIQGGCPRGDGFGALDYTIRSEVPQLYYSQEGRVGMASSGIHTEGVQFFITHSPTPHLDGKYTIFAQVEEGMDVVHAIEKGDAIEKVVIQ